MSTAEQSAPAPPACGSCPSARPSRPDWRRRRRSKASPDHRACRRWRRRRPPVLRTHGGGSKVKVWAGNSRNPSSAGPGPRRNCDREPRCNGRRPAGNLQRGLKPAQAAPTKNDNRQAAIPAAIRGEATDMTFPQPLRQCGRQSYGQQGRGHSPAARARLAHPITKKGHRALSGKPDIGVACTQSCQWDAPKSRGETADARSLLGGRFLAAFVRHAFRH